MTDIRYKSPEQLGIEVKHGLPWFIWLMLLGVFVMMVWLVFAMGQAHDVRTGQDTRPCGCRKHK